MAAHHGHDEHHQRPSVHTKQHGSQEQRWRRHIEHGRHVDRWTAPTAHCRSSTRKAAKIQPDRFRRRDRAQTMLDNAV